MGNSRGWMLGTVGGGWMLGTVGVEGNLIDGCGKIKFAIKELGFESSL